VLLNLLSLSLVFSNLAVNLVAGSLVLGILAWHLRPAPPSVAAI
jgi:hypothetical protein